MKNKMKNKKGFTLMEMLIVVAIMVVLVAVAVPTFSKQLDNAKKTADDANLRAAKAIAATTYLSEEFTETKEYSFDATNGKLDPSKATYSYGKYGTHDYIDVKIEPNGTITVKWHTGS